MFPKLRENVWHIDPQREAAILITGRGTYEVPTGPALQFLKMRSYCTGYNSVEAVAGKSGLTLTDVGALIGSLDRAGIVYESGSALANVSSQYLRDALVRACAIWAQELNISYIASRFASGELPRTVLLGWLIEMYHYIKDFPHAIEHGAQRARGELRKVLSEYAEQENGHEIFVLRTLMNLGFSEPEITESIPLLSTRLIGFLMRELFELMPSSALMVAAVIEAPEFNEPEISEFKGQLSRHYGFSTEALAPYFEHQRIDVSLGHSNLLTSHIELLESQNVTVLNQVVNKLHDLKHAFDLQGTEIISYYSELNGRYFPRQPVLVESISF